MNPSWRQITREVADKHGLPVDEVIGPRRFKRLIPARHEAMWRVREETSFSFPQIAAFFGKDDHTTVMNACKAHERRRAEWA